MYRYAYGASYSDEPDAIEEIHSLIKSIVAGSRGNVRLMFKSELDTIDPIVGKIIVCMFVTASGVCKNGELIIDISEKQIILTISGKLFQRRVKNFDILKGELAVNPLDVENVHEYYLYSLSQQANRVFVIDQSEDISTIQFIL